MSFRLRPTSSRLPTAPLVSGVPLLGNALDFRRGPRDFLIDAAAQYGPIFRIKGPGQKATVLTGDAGRSLMRRRSEEGLDRAELFDAFTTEAGVDIFGVTGAMHSRLRGLVRLAYSRQLTAEFSPQIGEVVASEVERWQTGDSARLLDLTSELAMRCVMTALTPVPLAHLTRDLIRFGNTVMYVVAGLKPYTVLKSPSYVRARNRVYRELEGVIARHQQGEFDDDRKMYMVDAFLAATNRDGDRMSLRDVRGGCCYALCGTEVYIGRLAGFMLYELLHNDTMRARVLGEIDAAFTNRQVDPDLLRRMPYFRATYYEALRMYPLLPGLPFKSTREFEIDGYRIPPGELVLVTPVAAHFNQQAYPNPFAFAPERCMAPRNEHLQGHGRFAPFGSGQRVCAAVGMVEILTLTLVGKLLHHRRLALRRPTYRVRLIPNPLIGAHDGIPVTIGQRRTPNAGSLVQGVLSEAADLAHPIEEARAAVNLPTISSVRYPAGTEIVVAGAAAGHFYLLLDGVATVLKAEATSGPNPSGRERLYPGRCFGEDGLLKQLPHPNTVLAETEVTLLQIARETILTHMERGDLRASEVAMMLQRQHVRRLLATAMPDLRGDALHAHAGAFQLERFSEGDDVIIQGQVADSFYVIASGTAKVLLRDAEGVEKAVGSLSPGDYFGELGIISGKPRAANVRATSDLEVLALPRDAFLAILKDSAKTREEVALTVCRRMFGPLFTTAIS